MAVRCSFDSDWEGLSKRFIFSNGNISKAVLLTSNEEVLIPHEVLTPGKLHISIIGQSENGEKKLTTAKAVPYITVLEAGPQDGNDPETYTPELWEQALIAIGDLTYLTTDKKNSIVSAINELNKGGAKTISGLKSTTKTSSGTLLGDVNGDGIIDTTDLIALQRYLDGTVTDIDMEAADLNGDGVVDAADFELMQKLFETMNSGQLIARIKITYTDGTSDTICECVDTTGKGEKGDTGAAGKDGANGKDGYTPVRGRDYWTEDDKKEIADEVLSHFSDMGTKEEAIVLTDMVGYLLKSSGNVVISSTGNPNRIVSQPVYASAGETFLFTCSANFGNALYVIYDITGAAIASMVADATEAGDVLINESVVMPENTSYFRLAANLDNYADGYAAKVIEVSIPSMATPSTLSGKKWVCLGDSLTERNNRTTKNYHDYIAEETKISVVNMGVGGTGYMNGQESSEAFYQRATSIPADADIVTVFGSGNDRNLPLGSITDIDTNTICGCINATIDAIRAAAPTAWIGIISPTPWQYYDPRNEGNLMDLYSAALRNICYVNGIPFLDLYHCSNLRPWDEAFRELAYSRDNGDGVHPDETGHAMIAPIIRDFLLSSAAAVRDGYTPVKGVDYFTPADQEAIVQQVLAALGTSTLGRAD